MEITSKRLVFPNDLYAESYQKPLNILFLSDHQGDQSQGLQLQPNGNFRAKFKIWVKTEVTIVLYAWTPLFFSLQRRFWISGSIERRTYSHSDLKTGKTGAPISLWGRGDAWCYLNQILTVLWSFCNTPWCLPPTGRTCASKMHGVMITETRWIPKSCCDFTRPLHGNVNLCCFDCWQHCCACKNSKKKRFRQGSLLLCSNGHNPPWNVIEIAFP